MTEVLKRLAALAGDLDSKGLIKEADALDKISAKIAHELFDIESDCGEELEDELYYLGNLSSMHEEIEREEEHHDLVDS